ncbi:polysaccharide pyruvyl transferase family protein [Pontibacter sp. BT310]|uniref:Polysaccharide pyruvyl transferase family protein n=1 Tax=Pontibacter populi TaxID=890055 RepID=A0ABS6XAV0_9BACT|nr:MULTISPECIES: polysaccharide pyruvyl transferase family protein [Pontibacter]MBJ6118248.1 polysaccharide pyruvyl transferase family protein [Pontibacter sp. BT310]MBR0570675.1 polysaccharide pyruvyl transferase family protein [Microvirga sp. STS03]MBW3365101.1 polysaccharide pyruvyl transferase family protein [Pontibacter populi]
MKKILFEGYYGHENTGDDAFIEVSAWGAETYWGTKNNFFLSRSLPKIKHSASCFEKQAFRGQYRLECLLQLADADAVVSAGGSTFEKAPEIMHIRNLSLLKKKTNGSLKIGAIGVSLGPYKNIEHERAIIEYLSNLDFLALRDEYSYKLALSYNLPYNPINAFDLAALLPHIYNPVSVKPDHEEKIFGISACYFERYRGITNSASEERRTNYLKSLLLEVSRKTNVKLRFFIFNGNVINGDQQITYSIINYLTSKNATNIEIVPYSTRTNFMYNKVSECDVILSVRLHASMFACFSQIPFFLVEYHRKCGDFLNSIGYHENYKIGDGTKDIAETVDQITAFLENKNNYVQPEKLVNCREKAMMNFTSVKL